MQVLKSSDVSNGVINTNEIFDGTYKLHSFTFTNNLYNITSNNNILPYQEGASYTAIELTQQYANGTDLATDIQTKINAVSAGTPSVVYNSNTGKFTITNTVSFYFKFGDITSNTCYNLLGFSQTNTSSNTSITSPNVADLVAFKHIYINIEQDTCKCVKTENFTNNTFLITRKCDFGDVSTYTSKQNDIYEQICYFRAEKRFKINFYDENNNTISPTNWILVLAHSF